MITTGVIVLCAAMSWVEARDVWLRAVCMLCACTLCTLMALNTHWLSAGLSVADLFQQWQNYAVVNLVLLGLLLERLRLERMTEEQFETENAHIERMNAFRDRIRAPFINAGRWVLRRCGRQS